MELKNNYQVKSTGFTRTKKKLAVGATLAISGVVIMKHYIKKATTDQKQKDYKWW